jgi:chemotaxis protein CheC
MKARARVRRPGCARTERPRALHVPRAVLTRFHLLSEAGAHYAAIAMSQIIGRPLHLDVPWARILPLEDVADMAGGASRVVCALSLKVYGELRGNLLLVFSREQIPLLLDLVVPRRAPGRHRAAGPHALDEMERSALMEIGNILGCAYLNALSRLLGVSLLPSIPGLALDMAGAVTDHLLIELAPVADTAVVLACGVQEPASGLRGEIFFLPHPDSLGVLGRAHEQEGRAGAAARSRAR